MKQFFLTLFAVVCTAASSGQSLEECRHLAREHYPEIRQYDLIAQTEQYNLSNAARAWIPQVTLSGQATYQSATPTYPEAFNTILQANGIEMAGISRDQYKIAVDVSQHIWDGGKSKADKAIAQAEAEEQRSRVDVSLYDLQSRVDNLYFGILLLDERKAQTEALIEVLASNLARLQTYYKNGVAMQADVDAVEAELLTARQTLVQVESSRYALAIASANFYDNPSRKLTLVGITGTNGKTTTVTLLYRMFTSLGYSCGLLSTIANYVGNKGSEAVNTTSDPLTINSLLNDMVNEGCE
ncbi:MAG: TolC family protein, partial [Alistipes sp.]|nr:TolC family protein [Alistipes sp.]